MSRRIIHLKYPSILNNKNIGMVTLFVIDKDERNELVILREYPCPNVSKSLLIVLGTLSLPDKNDREKYRIAGIESSRNAWTTRQTRVVHPFHRPFTSMITCLQCCSMLSTLKQRGQGGLVRPTRFPVSASLSAIFPAANFMLAFLTLSISRQAHAIVR